MIKYNIIQDTKYFTLKECRNEIQNILEGKEQTIQKDKLMESINKTLNNKKNNLTLECYYQFLLDAIQEKDEKEIKKYCKRLDFKL